MNILEIPTDKEIKKYEKLKSIKDILEYEKTDCLFWIDISMSVSNSINELYQEIGKRIMEEWEEENDNVREFMEKRYKEDFKQHSSAESSSSVE